MKVCVLGVGAIGGILAAALSRGGAQVSLLARAQTLTALQNQGLRVVAKDTVDDVQAPALRLSASDDPAALGPQDAVVLAVKSQQIEAALAQVEALLAPDGVVVSAQNGIPWWYFHAPPGTAGVPDSLTGSYLESVDPGGSIVRRLPAERCIGAVLYLAAEVAAPGFIRRAPGGRVQLGPAWNMETTYRAPDKTRRLVTYLSAGGEAAEFCGDIRGAIWEKLRGNVAFNPLSALTESTLAQIARDPGLRKLSREVMLETEAVAKALGITFSTDVETRIERAGAVGEHRSSMLQDLDAGRVPESGALMAAVSEIGRWADVETPFLDAITALVEARARHGR